MSTTKKRHHYVWKHYLNAWVANGNILCLHGDKIFESNPANLGVEGYFYSIEPWTNEDISLARTLVGNGNCANLDLLNIAEFCGILGRENKNKKIQECISSLLENYHERIEKLSIDHVASMLKCDLKFLEVEEEKIRFINFLCVQYFRTKSIKTKVTNQLQRCNKIDVSRIWNVLALCFACNTGAALYKDKEKRKINLMINNTTHPFITSDQPVINLLASGDGHSDRLAFYYPISPNMAVVLNDIDSDILSSTPVTTDFVRSLNAKLASFKHAQLYGSSCEALQLAMTDEPWQT